MPKTQDEALTDLLDRLNETTGSETSGVWTNPQLRRYLNEGVREVARSAEFFRTHTTATVTAGTQTIPLPADTIRPYRVEWFTSPTAHRIPLEYARRSNLDQIWGWGQVIATGRPRWWTLEGFPGGVGNAAAHIVVYPTPSENANVKIFYYAYPPDLPTDGSAGSVNLQVPNGWEDLPVDWAEYRAWRQVRHAESAAAALATFRDHLSALIQASSSDFVADQPGEAIYEPVVHHW